MQYWHTIRISDLISTIADDPMGFIRNTEVLCFPVPMDGLYGYAIIAQFDPDGPEQVEKPSGARAVKIVASKIDDDIITMIPTTIEINTSVMAAILGSLDPNRLDFTTNNNIKGDFTTEPGIRGVYLYSTKYGRTLYIPPKIMIHNGQLEARGWHLTTYGNNVTLHVEGHNGNLYEITNILDALRRGFMKSFEFKHVHVPDKLQHIITIPNGSKGPHIIVGTPNGLYMDDKPIALPTGREAIVDLKVDATTNQFLVRTPSGVFRTIIEGDEMNFQKVCDPPSMAPHIQQDMLTGPVLSDSVLFTGWDKDTYYRKVVPFHPTA